MVVLRMRVLDFARFDVHYRRPGRGTSRSSRKEIMAETTDTPILDLLSSMTAESIEASEPRR